MERAYTEQDLANLSQKELVLLIQRQIVKWPLTPGKISKTKKDALKTYLLDTKYGFTTDKPAICERSESARVELEVLNNGAPPRLPLDEHVNITREIRLLIDDRRAIGQPAHTSQRVRVNCVDSAGLSQGEWRADGLEVLIALQTSLSKLTGSGRIGVPDRLHPSYTEYFVEFIAEQPIETLTVNPDTLVISPDGHLVLRVDCTVHLPVSLPATVLCDTGILGVVPGSSNPPTAIEPGLQEPALREVEWLKSKLSARLGSAKFTASHHKVLQNAERVRYWRFAADFTRDFHKKNWPQDVSSSKAIPKTAIEKALQMSRSALLDANQMIEIIDRFTAEGDANYSQQVADTVNKHDDEVPNTATLKAFLKKWDREHGGHGWED
ncbi:hypothetical protein C8R46DRAFT_1291437 [Mycena filopes]|nr:hypothetical protein C8R46DRAFT_1291437 [Mycena filopes]